MAAMGAVLTKMQIFRRDKHLLGHEVPQTFARGDRGDLHEKVGFQFINFILA